ncbi:MAG: HNH endonuclease [Anaerolineae bacterium]|nr:HNH endonuclease [Anaerolineae bacterium]
MPRRNKKRWRKLRQEVMFRDGWRCQWPGCGRRKHQSVHHIIFREHGGQDEEANLITLCRSHHDYLHDQVRKLRKARAERGRQKAGRPGLFQRVRTWLFGNVSNWRQQQKGI